MTRLQKSENELPRSLWIGILVFTAIMLHLHALSPLSGAFEVDVTQACQARR
jgi:hypothetical protein